MVTRLKSKVFISCGQNSDNEKIIAIEIDKRINSLGYETYLAIEQHSLKGLKENIFNNLIDSEYFLFIDFRREKLQDVEGNSSGFRGSLYTNQELAIATLLEKDVIAYQNESIKNSDGMLGSIQLNAIKFSDDDIRDLPEKIESKIIEQGWSNHWKNKLQASVSPSFMVVKQYDNIDGTFYHLKVENLHKDKIARNCTATIKSIIDLTNRKDITSETVELKWAGTIIHSVSIMPQTFRLLDAFFVKHNTPSTIQFLSYADSPYHLPGISGTTNYEITYLILSENFLPIEIKTFIGIKGDIETIDFHEIS
jgi:hypothetical protein